MKRLYIVRHAKSAWKDNTVFDDIDRPLKKTGIYNAYLMAKFLVKNKIQLPQYFLSSPAARAVYTALIFARVFKHDVNEVHLAGEIYDGSINKILNLISKIPSDVETAMIFGHNPLLLDFINYMIDDFVKTLPTLGIVEVSFQVNDWKLIDKNTGKLVNYYNPSAL